MSGYRLTPDAKHDLRAIRDYYRFEKGSPFAADKVLHDVGVLLDKIAVTPGIGHTREDLTRLDLHFVRTGPYMIAYRADARPIEIVRILHGSRNLPVILGLLEP